MKVLARKGDIINRVSFKSGQVYFLYNNYKINIYQAKKLILDGTMKCIGKNCSKYKLIRNVELSLKK